jgi:hypothetical protein
MADCRPREAHVAIECCQCRYTTGWQVDLARAKDALVRDRGRVEDVREGLLLTCPKGHGCTRIEMD